MHLIFYLTFPSLFLIETRDSLLNFIFLIPLFYSLCFSNFPPNTTKTETDLINSASPWPRPVSVTPVSRPNTFTRIYFKKIIVHTRSSTLTIVTVFSLSFDWGVALETDRVQSIFYRTPVYFDNCSNIFTK